MVPRHLVQAFANVLLAVSRHESVLLDLLAENCVSDAECPTFAPLAQVVKVDSPDREFVFARLA